MSGLKITLPVNFTDTTLPVLTDDSVLTGIGGGSLVLAETSDMLTMPTPGSATPVTIPNVAASRALPLLAAGTAQTDADPHVWCSTLESNVGKIERTARNALHTIVTKTNGPASPRGVQINMRSAIRNYLVANPGHAYGLWVWKRPTRLRTGPSSGSGQLHSLSFAQTPASAYPYTDSQAISLMLGYGQTTTLYNPGNVSGYYTLNSAADNQLAALRQAVAVKGGWSVSSGSIPTAGANMVAAINTGTVASVDPTLENSGDSAIIYRIYLEDLTVSGRTPAAVDALDAAAFAAAFASGGRFYNDTFTDPATLP